ncbi:MAG: hypothetical protein ACOYMO_04215 [Phycisphaerales bacterium]|jgi:hypothetical protein
MRTAAMLAVAMLLTISVAAIAGCNGTGANRGSAAVMPLQRTDGQEVRELTAATGQQPRSTGGSGMLTAQPRGTNDPATAPASWRTLNLPPPTTP